LESEGFNDHEERSESRQHCDFTITPGRLMPRSRMDEIGWAHREGPRKQHGRRHIYPIDVADHLWWRAFIDGVGARLRSY
jgi:hypothetical protein